MSKKALDSNLDFDGMKGDGVSRGATKMYCGNQSGLSMKENYGRGPTKAGTTGKTAGAPTAAGGKIDGGREWKPSAGQNYKGNFDKINAGQGPRKGNE